MQYTLKGKSYQIVIEDGAIELQSLHETIMFQDAYTQICNELEAEYWQDGWSHNYSLKDFIDYHEHERIRCYLDENRNEGIIIDHNLN